MKPLHSLLLAVLVLSAVADRSIAQSRKSVLSNQYIEKLLTERNFVFTTYFIGEDFTGRPLASPDYNFSIFGNKVTGELPYIGSSYSMISFTSFAPYFKLNSTNYYYNAVALNDSNWRVLIEPIQDKYIKAVIMNITKNGYDNLTVINNRSKAFNYSGNIVPAEGNE